MAMTRTTITDIGTVTVTVADQDKAVVFYTETLGFEKRMDALMPNGGRWITVAPPGSAVAISLAPASNVSPAGVDTGIRLTAANAAEDHATLQARGTDVDDVANWPGVPPMFSFRDRDGNTLYVVETSGTGS